MLERGEGLPPSSRPEVAKVLMEGMNKGARTPGPATCGSRGDPVSARPAKKRVLVIGLDCGEPSLFFDQYRSELRNLHRSCRRECGVSWRASSPDHRAGVDVLDDVQRPGAIWACMGFATARITRTRKMITANARARFRNRRCGTTSSGRENSHGSSACPPRSAETDQRRNGRLFPVAEHPIQIHVSRITARRDFSRRTELYWWTFRIFRTEDKAWLLGKIYEMTEDHFKVMRHVMKEKALGHAHGGRDRRGPASPRLLEYHDPLHPKHEPGNPLIHSIHDYYVWLDQQIGSVLELIDETIRA